MGSGFKFAFDAIGTSWVIDIYEKKLEDFSGLDLEIHEEIKKFSDTFSRFDKNSKVFELSKKGGRIDIDKKYQPLLDLYLKLYKQTFGKFTPLIGNILVEAGYDAQYSLVPKKINPVKKWEDVLDFRNGVLNLKENAVLDFGAAGKGFLADLIGKLLEKNGINSYCIDASGDILYKTDGENLKVGLEHPQNPKQIVGVAEVKNESICASAGNRKRWGNYNHIFNPDALKSVEDILAVWVVAETGAIADGLATCLFLVEPEKLKDFKFEYVILNSDLTVKKSKDFPGEIFYN